nr:MAG TPA: hypothetical protein [Caudoviricetes sp.]
MEYILAFVLALLAGVTVIELLDWAMPTGADKHQRRMIELCMASLAAVLCIGSMWW